MILQRVLTSGAKLILRCYPFVAFVVSGYFKVEIEQVSMESS